MGFAAGNSLKRQNGPGFFKHFNLSDRQKKGLQTYRACLHCICSCGNALNNLPVIALMLARILPFALFMIFIGVEEGLQYTVSRGFITLPSTTFIFLYPIKIASVLALLWYFRGEYSELRWSDLQRWSLTIFSVITGILVFIFWIQMTWPFAVCGTLYGYDPTSIEDNSTRWAIIASRLFGAAIVVPIMEELFWRSFVVRYIIKPQFEQVPVGSFTVAAFVISAVLFGLEHNLWLAGIMAGLAYNYLLYRTKSIAQCILAHSVTNAALGLYVTITGSWHFW